MWNRILVLLKSRMIYVSSDEESDGDKDYKEDSHVIHMRSWKNNYYTMTHYLLNFDSGTKLTQVTNIIVK